MTIEEFKKEISKIKGVSEVESYTLISNYGVHFKKGGYTFDVRYWANCYGVALNYWGLMACEKFYNDGRKIEKKNADDLSEFLPTIKAL